MNAEIRNFNVSLPMVIKTYKNFDDYLKTKILDSNGFTDYVAITLLKDLRPFLLINSKVSCEYKYFKNKYSYTSDKVLDSLMTLHGLGLIRGCEYYFFHKKDENGNRDQNTFHFMPIVELVRRLFELKF